MKDFLFFMLHIMIAWCSVRFDQCIIFFHRESLFYISSPTYRIQQTNLIIKPRMYFGIRKLLSDDHFTHGRTNDGLLCDKGPAWWRVAPGRHRSVKGRSPDTSKSNRSRHSESVFNSIFCSLSTLSVMLLRINMLCAEGYFPSSKSCVSSISTVDLRTA